MIKIIAKRTLAVTGLILLAAGALSSRNTLPKSKQVAKSLKDNLREANYRTLFKARNKNARHEDYFIDTYGELQKKYDYAVVLHIYYAENWENVFAKRLKRLRTKLDYDLYVTMPESNVKYVENIQKVFPEVKVCIVPNMGRDVLPFIKTAVMLKEIGYKKVLKIHAKKSTHRDLEGNAAESGDDWLNKTLDALVPSTDRHLAELVAKVKSPNTGMIGALGYYYPLKMYLSHNIRLIKIIMDSIDRDLFSGNVANRLDKMGFFGGTMFWVDLDVIADTFMISKTNFQKEAGQTDGTIAHALERVFSILPQIKNKDLYGVSTTGITKITEHTASYPDWYYDDMTRGKPHISIVVPVYGDWESLAQNIKSLKKYVGNSERVAVYYVNDCGPDADEIEKNILKNISNMTNFYYFRNEKNLGFVQTCNGAAFKIVNQKDDVLLLNSDTKVTKDFVFSLQNVLYSEAKIGAVTSRSNNATIWSVPMTGRLANQRLGSYLLYRSIKRTLPEKYITPTIHGFCVLIRREVIAKFGLFDEVYGKGYGEENDFAMRLRKNGWKCAVANYSFVFHYESRSFGKVERNEHIERNEKILTKRYPEYRQLVQEYWDSIKEPLK